MDQIENRVLPLATQEEELGMQLMHQMFDGLDYTIEGSLSTNDEEMDRLITIGMNRYWLEETYLWKDE